MDYDIGQVFVWRLIMIQFESISKKVKHEQRPKHIVATSHYLSFFFSFFQFSDIGIEL